MDVLLRLVDLVFISYMLPELKPLDPGACFSKAPETARKASLVNLYPKDRKLYTPESSFIEGTSGHIKKKRMKQLCSQIFFLDFASAFRVRKRFETRLSGNGPQSRVQ